MGMARARERRPRRTRRGVDGSAFIEHTVNALKDVSRQYKGLKALPERASQPCDTSERSATDVSPFRSRARSTGITRQDGREAEWGSRTGEDGETRVSGTHGNARRIVWRCAGRRTAGGKAGKPWDRRNGRKNLQPDRTSPEGCVLYNVRIPGGRAPAALAFQSVEGEFSYAPPKECVKTCQKGSRRTKASHGALLPGELSRRPRQMHVENLTPKTRQRYLDFLQLREEGRENVFIEAAADTMELELMKEIGREEDELLYRLFSPRPEEAPRSGLAKACSPGRLMREERLGRQTLSTSSRKESNDGDPDPRADGNEPGSCARQPTPIPPYAEQ